MELDNLFVGLVKPNQKMIVVDKSVFKSSKGTMIIYRDIRTSEVFLKSLSSKKDALHNTSKNDGIGLEIISSLKDFIKDSEEPLSLSNIFYLIKLYPYIKSNLKKQASNLNFHKMLDFTVSHISDIILKYAICWDKDENYPGQDIQIPIVVDEKIKKNFRHSLKTYLLLIYYSKGNANSKYIISSEEINYLLRISGVFGSLPGKNDSIIVYEKENNIFTIMHLGSANDMLHSIKAYSSSKLQLVKEREIG